MPKPIQIKPQAIEAKSFAIIAEEFFKQTGRRVDDFPKAEFAVIQRVIHATGDFSFAKNMVFHPDAIKSAITMLQAGRNIITDVNMAATGINKTILSKWGGRVICKVADPAIAELARQKQATRSEVAMQTALADNPGIIAIGNAPTALLRVMELLHTSDITSKPGVIIGVPVGFVNAAESKDILTEQDIPFITSLGRKGGSPVAAAMVNALMKLAIQGDQ